MSKEYCPECIVELEEDHKQLGQYSVWLVCPRCGFRKREEWELTDEKAIQRYKMVNENNFYHGQDEENDGKY